MTDPVDTHGGGAPVADAGRAPSGGGQARVLTLVFTDLAESTALKTERGDTAVGGLIARHRDHVSELALHCGGEVVDWAGDGCFLTFDTSSAAVTFGLRLQQIHHYEDDLPKVRIGIHLGEVTTRPFGGGRRVEGLAVDMAARISGLAQPGQLLISGGVQQSAKQRLGIREFGQPIRWETYGAYTLKGIDEPVDIREAGLDPFSPFIAPPASEKAWPARSDSPAGTVSAAPSQGPIRKLAVLPLANLSGDPQQDFFVDGMTEAIITELARIKALRVTSRTSVMRYKNTTKPLTEIAAELSVDGLIEGSVIRADNDVRVTAQFIRGDSDEHLWAEHYDSTVDNILKLQREIALTIADEIEVAVSADERATLGKAEQIDPEAYDLYLKAAQFGGDWSPKSIYGSLKMLDEVVARAPDFGKAYTIIATAHYFLGVFGYAPSAECFSKARKAARKAIRFDDSDGGAHANLGWVAMSFEWDWAEAEYRFERALELGPTNYWAHLGQAFLNVILNRPEEALKAAYRGRDVAPNYAPALHNIGMTRFWNGDVEGGLKDLREIVAKIRNALPTHIDGILAAACAGQHEQAMEYAERAIEIGGPQPRILANKAFALAKGGDAAAAEEILAKIRAHDGPAQVLNVDIATVHVGLGNVDAAMDALEIAFRDREYSVALIGKSPVFDPVRDHPRFQALIDIMDLPAN